MTIEPDPKGNKLFQQNFNLCEGVHALIWLSYLFNHIISFIIHLLFSCISPLTHKSTKYSYNIILIQLKTIQEN